MTISTLKKAALEGAIVLLSMTAIDDVIWETFDEGGELVDTAKLTDFARVLGKQQLAAAAQ